MSHTGWRRPQAKYVVVPNRELPTVQLSRPHTCSCWGLWLRYHAANAVSWNVGQEKLKKVLSVRSARHRAQDILVRVRTVMMGSIPPATNTAPSTQQATVISGRLLITSIYAADGFTSNSARSRQWGDSRSSSSTVIANVSPSPITMRESTLPFAGPNRKCAIFGDCPLRARWLWFDLV